MNELDSASPLPGRLAMNPDDPASILFVSHSGEPGGAELCLLDFVRTTPGTAVALFSDGPFRQMLDEAGAKTHLIAAGNILELRRGDGLGAVLRRLPSFARLIISLTRLSRKHDAIYANSQKAMIACAATALLTRRPLIWHLHDILSASGFSPFMRRVSVATANRVARLVITNSVATADAFEKAGGTAPVAVVHNGIDPTPFQGRGEIAAQREVRTEIKSGAGRVIGLFGRIAPWKGQDVAIRAIRDLPDHHLVIVGAAFFGEEPYERYLRDLCSDNGLTERVHFLGFRRDVPTLMRAMDVIIHSSTEAEPFGRVIVEGMMAEVPVIATAAGGALEIVEDGINGLLVRPNDPDALKAKLSLLSSDTELSSRLARRGREWALTNFALDTSIERLWAAILRGLQTRK